MKGLPPRLMVASDIDAAGGATDAELAGFLRIDPPLPPDQQAQAREALGAVGPNDVAQAIAEAVPPRRTVSADTNAVNGETITVDARFGPVTITLPAAGGVVVVRMPENLAVNLVTISGNGRLIDGEPAVTSDDWAGYALTLTSADDLWTYSAQYIYGVEVPPIPARALRFSSGSPLQFSDGSFLELTA